MSIEDHKKHWLASAPAMPGVNLFQLPGWAGPVRSGIAQAANARYVTPFERGQATYRTELARRRQEIKARGAALLARAAELGKSWGAQVFADAVTALTEQNAEAFERLAVQTILARFEECRLTLAAPQARSEQNDIGFAHWTAARAQFAGHVVQFLAAILTLSETTIGPAAWREEWRIDDVQDLVLVYLAPDQVDGDVEAQRAAYDVRLAAIYEAVQAARAELAA